jgi:osmotically-inducible protein OsmY
VHAAGIRVGAQAGVVTLEGTVPATAEKDAAEGDAWCVSGVHGVLNRLAVQI